MAKVLVVQSGARQPALSGVLEQEGYETHRIESPEEALAWAAVHSPDCIVAELELPGMGSFELIERLKSDAHTRLIPVVLACDEANTQRRLDALAAGADELFVRPVDPGEARVRLRALVRTRGLTLELENAQNVVFALATAMEQKDSYTEGHGERVGMFSRSLAEHLGLSPELVQAVQTGGLLHDVGKIGCPDRILNKPGPLTPDEFEVIKRHPVAGWEICRHLRSLGSATLHCIRNHHERLDGTGYPDSLPADKIPITTRITTICDVFDALATARAYKPAFPTETCFKILREEAVRGWWDKELVEAFIDMMNDRQLFMAANRAKLKPLFARPPAELAPRPAT
ncbi:MAG: HD domain-containing phosphohydrolase [Planctomycetota bacterium]